MSYHSKVGWRPTPHVSHQVLYALSLKVYRLGSCRADSLAGRVLQAVGSMALTGKVAQPGQAALGRMFGRSTRSIRRSVASLVAGGYITCKRRGKKLTNAYRLTKSLWRRLTNHQTAAPRRPSRPTGCQLELRAVLDRVLSKYAPAFARGAPIPA